MPKTGSIRSSASMELRLVTDRHRQTDGHRAMASTRASIASREENVYILDTHQTVMRNFPDAYIARGLLPAEVEDYHSPHTSSLSGYLAKNMRVDVVTLS